MRPIESVMEWLLHGKLGKLRMENMSQHPKIINQTFYPEFGYSALRTILDPYSAEWRHTTMDEKLEIVKALTVDEKMDLSIIMRDYINQRSNGSDDSSDVTLSLIDALSKLLTASIS